MGKKLIDSRVGYVRSIELTLDDLRVQRYYTGTHVHFHLMLVTAFEPAEDYRAWFYALWARACAKQGLVTDRQGFDFQVAQSPAAAAKYVVKGGSERSEALGWEVTSSGTKQAGSGRLTPEELLRVLGDEVEAVHGKYDLRKKVTVSLREGGMREEMLKRLIAQWRGIEDAMQRTRWISWGGDLRRKAGLYEEKSDEEIANEQKAPGSENVAVVYNRVREGFYISELADLIHSELMKCPDDIPARFQCLLRVLDDHDIRYVVMPYEVWSEGVADHLRARGPGGG